MKIQFCSDLHLEFDANADYLKRNPVNPVGDIIILAGDITYLNFYHQRQTEKDFITYLSDNFNFVYLMLGNHEFYGGDDIGILDKPVYEKLSSNVALVNNTTSTHNNTKIIFSALWSKISEKNKSIVSNGMNDFRLIPYHGRMFSVEDFNKLHEHSVQFIQKELQKNYENQKVVIATHHVPTKACNSPDFEGSPLNDAFIADLDDLILNNNINYWVYGHIHRNLPEIIVGNTKLVSNQLGYIHANEYKGYKNDAFIEIN